MISSSLANTSMPIDSPGTEVAPALEDKWKEIQPEVEEAWNDIFKVVDTVLSHHDRFGYKLIASKINPTFADIVISLKVMEQILDTLEGGLDDYGLSRMVINAKQQIVLIESIVTALKYGEEGDYEQAIGRLRGQARF